MEPGAAARDRQVKALEAAVAADPDDGLLRVALADAYYLAYKELSAEPAKAARAADDGEPARRYLTPALRHFLLARAACPLLAAPHVQLAALRDRLGRADPRRAYLERATRLRPSDAELWYLAGAQQLLDGEPAQACRSWRRSLECSEAFLGEIVRDSRPLGPGDADALPDKPDLLFRAAFKLDPGPEDATARERFLARALALLRDQPGGRQAKDFHLEALIRDALNQPAQALDAYRSALVRDPLQAGWRYEYARLLYRQGRSGEAERELRVVLREQPGNAEAQRLLRTVLEGPAGGG
jgi:tetratricopeptide (TPR) repeat protein